MVWQDNDSYTQTVILLCFQSLTFILYIAYLAYVVCNLKKNIMIRLSVILALFALILFLRLNLDVLRIIYFDSDLRSLSITIMKILRDIFTKLLWFGIYFFILDISDIKNKIQSQSFEEYSILEKIHIKRQRRVLSTLVVLSLL